MHLQIIRNKLINKALFFAVWFTFPTLAASLIRIHYLGWFSLFYFHIAFTLIITLLFFFRNQLPLHTKTLIFCFVYYAYSFVGSLYFGLAAGLFFYAFVIIISTIVFGMKGGITGLFLSLSGLLIAGILHAHNYVEITVNLNKYTSTFNSWISYILGFMFVFTVIIILLKNYNDYFHANIEALKQLSNDNILARQKAEESDKLKTSFLQNISHEVRTPLNGILGFSNLVMRNDCSEEKRNKYLSIILTSSNQLLTIINDILAISAIETKQVSLMAEKTDVNEVLQIVYSSFKSIVKKEKVEFRITAPLSNDKLIIESDKMKLIQILSYLINNAIKFTSQGFIEIGYEKGTDPYITFYVKDSGIGIDKAFHALIFERFRQANSDIARDYGGNGLGLTISKAYVELMGGKIWVESELEKGSAFYFTLPVNKPF